MSDKYNKITPKVHPYTLAAIVGFFVVMIGLIFVFTPSNQEKIYTSYKNVAEGSFFTEDHPFYEVTYDGSLFSRGLKRIIEKDDVVVLYIGNVNCPACLSHIGAFQEYFNVEGMNEVVKHIYYLNTLEDPNGFKKLFEAHQLITANTPQLVVFKDGEIIATYAAPTVIPPTQTQAQAINSAVRLFYRNVLLTLNEE